MIVRFLFCVGILILATVTPVWVLVPFVVVYLFRYTAYELLILAFLFDGFYGMELAFFVPVYTLSTLIMLIIAEWVKPLISVYNQ